MKKRITTLLVAVNVLLITTACSENSVNLASDSEITATTTSEQLSTSSDEPNTLPLESESRTFTETFDGVVLTITLDSIYTQGDIISIITSVRNDTGETIGLSMPVTDSSSNTDILLRITNDELESSYRYARLTDIDTYGAIFDDGMGIVHIEAGEEYAKVQRFETYYVNFDVLDYHDFPNEDAFLEVARTLAPVGEYHGTAGIAVLCDDPYDSDGETTAHFLEFNLTIE